MTPLSSLDLDTYYETLEHLPYDLASVSREATEGKIVHAAEIDLPARFAFSFTTAKGPRQPEAPPNVMPRRPAQEEQTVLNLTQHFSIVLHYRKLLGIMYRTSDRLPRPNLFSSRLNGPLQACPVAQCKDCIGHRVMEDADDQVDYESFKDVQEYEELATPHRNNTLTYRKSTLKAFYTISKLSASEIPYKVA